MPRFNSRVLRQNLSAVFRETSVGGVEARKEATRILRARQLDMLDAFDSHPVTEEINEGPDAPNITGTLSYIENLYSFIGFDKNPIPTLRKILARQDIVRLGQRTSRQVRANTVRMTWPILVPTESDLESNFSSELRMPKDWDTGIWPVRISRGISGLSYYVRKSGYGRSKGGFQVRHQVNKGLSYRRTSYLSDIFAAL